MTIAAQAIIKDAHTNLQDVDGVRWPASELVGYLNDGQLVLATERPDAFAVTAPFTLVAGTDQALLSTQAALIDITRNSGGKKRAIRKADADMLDAVAPNWRNLSPTAEIVHFTHDPREPRSFEVYPPAVADTQVELTASVYPVNVPEPTAPGQTATTVTGSIAARDEWKTPLMAYVLHRAYAKDAEFGGNPVLSAGWLSIFGTAIGKQLQAVTSVAPKT
jgi:hypothetical protein